MLSVGFYRTRDPKGRRKGAWVMVTALANNGALVLETAWLVCQETKSKEVLQAYSCQFVQRAPQDLHVVRI